MISLTGATDLDRAALARALAERSGVTGVSIADLGDDTETLALDVSAWGVEQVAEVLAPLVDGRVAAADAAGYLSELTLVHRLAACFDGAEAVWPEEIVGLRDDLADQIRYDCANPWIWDAWGLALTQEDDADRPTVAEGVVGWLNKNESKSSGGPSELLVNVHHAGALHTYGYLCSGLWTKYGWKRTRWLGGGIAAAAGIPLDLLRALPSSGTLLGNATVLAARLLGGEIADDHALGSAVQPTARLVGQVVEVATTVANAHGREPLDRPIEFRTSLFRRDQPPALRAPNLLVYTACRDGAERLVTIFDIDDAKLTSLLNPPLDEIGDDVPVRARYNAWLGSGSTLKGSRTITIP